MDVDDFKWGFKGIVTSWAGWYAIVWFILFLHLAAYLSLVVKWGALPLTILLVVFCQMLLFPMFMAVSWFFYRNGPASEDLMMGCLLTISLTVIVVLARQLPRRLKQLAGR